MLVEAAGKAEHQGRIRFWLPTAGSGECIGKIQIARDLLVNARAVLAGAWNLGDHMTVSGWWSTGYSSRSREWGVTVGTYPLPLANGWALALGRSVFFCFHVRCIQAKRGWQQRMLLCYSCK